MLKKSTRALLPAAVALATLALAPMPAGNAAVAGMLGMLPSGEISCSQAAAHWTSDADYQARVAQAQAIATMDDRGNQILAALGRVDAAAERCGLKGTTGAIDPAPAPGSATEDTGTDTAQSDPAGGISSGHAAGPAGNGGGGSAPVNPTAVPAPAPVSGAGGTAAAPVTDAEAVLGPIRNNTSISTKTIEILGQGPVEVADADAMMSNFLRQFTIII